MFHSISLSFLGIKYKFGIRPKLRHNPLVILEFSLWKNWIFLGFFNYFVFFKQKIILKATFLEFKAIQTFWEGKIDLKLRKNQQARVVRRNLLFLHVFSLKFPQKSVIIERSVFSRPTDPKRRASPPLPSQIFNKTRKLLPHCSPCKN